jgi:isoamylase
VSAYLERSSVPFIARGGTPYPLGLTLQPGGANFALTAAHARSVELLLFDNPYDPLPARVHRIAERSGAIWHAFIPGVRAGQAYGVRVDGPWAPHEGHRYDRSKVLLDPYARALARPYVYHPTLQGGLLHPDGRDSAATAPLAAVAIDAFDWQGVAAPRVPLTDTVLYEAHVRGLTMLHPDVPEELRGTYLGVAHPSVIAHLRALGVTALSLLPVTPVVDEPHLLERGLVNYWGYHPLCYLAPEPRYAAHGPPAAVNEFRTMVRELHRAGIEVIVDVVFNHSGEGSERGPTLSLRGIDHRGYYLLVPSDPSRTLDYTGTGNTLDVRQPAVVRLIADALRHWVVVMGVDGFRFDLATTLARRGAEIDWGGALMQVIEQDPQLAGVKLIAEPWDLGPNGYQVGGFPSPWLEWNGRYRDVVRAYWAGEPHHTGAFATALGGSADLYDPTHRGPLASVNFVTAHDGFTLLDLVSYDRKHNHANGEEGRDGRDDEYQQNFGVEGPTKQRDVVTQRDVRRRALLTTLALSQGIPMLLGGDELSRSQRGNNNAYCHDSPLSWFDWSIGADRAAFLAYARALFAFRRAHPALRRRTFLAGRPGVAGSDVAWWHRDGRTMTPADWHGSDPTFAMLLHGAAMGEGDALGRPRTDVVLLAWFAGGRGGSVVMPPAPDATSWTLRIDSAAGVIEPADAPPSSSVAAGGRVRLTAGGITVWCAARQP